MAMAAHHYSHGEHRPAALLQQSIGWHASTGEAAAKSALPINSLRKWLNGSWALLFSHADDFAAYGFEADRWLMMLHDAFASADVRPLALASNSSHSAGWVTEVGGRVAVLPADDTRRYPLLRDAYQHILCEAVRETGSRFVMILDDALRLRRTFTYGMQDRLPSPIDFIAMAEKLRSAGVKNFPGV